MTRSDKLTLLACCAATFLLAAQAYATSRGPTPTRISYADLDRKYVVIGPLGVELGKVVELQVEQVETRAKAEPEVLRVKAINGKPLPKPVDCPYRMLVIRDHFVHGKTFRVKAYQDGSYTGTPREVLKDMLIPTTDYGFQVALVVYKYLD